MFLLPVMLLLFSGGSAEVVNDFRYRCPQYFMNKIPPTILPGNWYKSICQTLGGTQYYATLYDTQNKIPVYSAYKFTGSVQCNRPKKWYIEPQLERKRPRTELMDSNEDREHLASVCHAASQECAELEEDFAGKNMELQDGRGFDNQASNKDYEKSGYDRGHLAPVYHADSKLCADATFTLTNAAPQLGSFNRQWFHKVESNMASTVTDHCIPDTAHIVTGVVPGTDIIKNRVRVPSHFWSAYCCKNKTNQLISGGFIGENSQGSTIVQKTVNNLETELKNLYQVESFFLFDNNCRDAGYVSVIPQ